MASKTAYCPDSHVQLGTGFASIGTSPGQQYHRVEAVVSSRGGKYRVHVVETWGSNQGCYYEEHGRHSVVARGGTVAEAAREARERAMVVEMDAAMVEEAIGEAEDEAEDAE